MAIVNQIQQIRGTTAQNEAFTGLVGVLSVDLDKKTLRVHDGATAGGSVLAKEAIKLKTDTDALLKFNAGAEADHAADISITLDRAGVANAVVEEMEKDATIPAALAPLLVSAKEGNAIQVADGDSEDGLLYVEPQDVEALVKSDDAILSVVNDKIQSTLAFSYTALDGKFLVTGKDGATIYEGVIPTSLTLLKTAEVVTDPEGQPEGTYLHFVFTLQSGAESEVYVNVTSFIDIYTAGDGLQMNADDDHKFELKLAASGNQAAIDGAGALVVPTDYGTLD